MTAQNRIPTTISPEAQAILKAVHERPAVPTPAASDTEAWAAIEALTSSTDSEIPEMMAMATVGAPPSDVHVDSVDRTINGARFTVATPESWTPDDPRVVMNMHGGGFRRRRDGRPSVPAGLGLMTPPTDFTFQGDSWYTNAEGTSPDDFTNMLDSYKAEYPADHPYISPLFGEYDDTFPPTIITSGTRDMLLSDAVRLHRKLVNAGVMAELHVWEAGPHGLFGGVAPEDRELLQQIRTFLLAQLK